MLTRVFLSKGKFSFQSLSRSFSVIDLRSDTVTRPDKEMKERVLSCELGDDVFGDDPTVLALEDRMSELTGMERSLFVPSGTMANLLAIGSVATTSSSPGPEIIVGLNSHIFRYEVGGASRLFGCSYHTLEESEVGELPLPLLQKAIREDDIHCQETVMVCVENTHNKRGGVPLPPTYLQQVQSLCEEHNLHLHMDGARLFNAATALDTPLSALCEPVDSVSVCFSKGLGAPVGSVLSGRAPFIAKARKLRKMLGGGMRQVGVLASMCLAALEEDRLGKLAEDHRKMAAIIEHVQTHPLVKGTVPAPQDGVRSSNIVYVQFKEPVAVDLVRQLEERGVLVTAYSEDQIRLVTHRDVTEEQAQEAVGHLLFLLDTLNA